MSSHDRGNPVVRWFKETTVWRSLFRQPYPTTSRTRALAVMNNVFLHLHPVRVKRHAVRYTYTFCLGGLSFFGQYVDQDLGGLGRTGLEGEVSWRFDLPLVWAVDDRQLFTFISPAVRYSKLDNDFRSHPLSPAPSLAWDWEKLDYGVRLGVFEGIDLTAEYADNSFILGSGAERENDELLTTLRWRL